MRTKAMLAAAVVIVMAAVTGAGVQNARAVLLPGNTDACSLQAIGVQELCVVSKELPRTRCGCGIIRINACQGS